MTGALTPKESLTRHMLRELDKDALTAFCRKCDRDVMVWERSKGIYVCEAKQRDVQREHLLTRYGITPAEYDALYEKQDGKCAICFTSHVPLHVDHCHDSLKVRGLLCGPCNRGLGMFYDEPLNLRAAARYIEENE